MAAGNFFKPTIAKIFILLVLIWFIPVAFGSVCASCSVENSAACGCHGLTVYTFDVFTGKVAWFMLFRLLPFYVGLVVSYLIACILEYGYRKYVRKEKN